MLNPRNKPKRILIVDDETTLVFFLRQGLQESDTACIVDGASSGEEALTKLTYNRYDLMVTDLKMPGITGFTLVEVARSLHPNIHIILITAFGSPEVLGEAKHLEVDGYLTKPFPIAQLHKMISDILATPGQASQNLIIEQSRK